MRELLKRHWVLGIVVLVSGLQVLYYVTTFDLLGPAVRLYNDADHQYVLSATYVLSGPQVPLFVHPGLTETFFLGWFFALLKALSLISASSLTDFQQSPEPFDRMISLLNAGRAWSAIVACAYLAVVYGCAVKWTANRRLGAVAVGANVFYIGILEHAFVVRPEPLSVLFCLSIVPIWLWLRGPREFRLAIPLIALSGALLSLALFTKVLAILYLPFWLLMAGSTLRWNGTATPRYWPTLGLLLSLAAVLIFAWRDLVDLQRALAPFSVRHHGAITVLRTWSLWGAAGAAALFVAVALAAGRSSPAAPHGAPRLAVIRKAILAALACLCGAVGALFVFDLNLAPVQGEWARTLVSTAMVETVGFSYLNADQPAHLIDALVSRDLRFFLFSNMWGVLVLAGLGAYFCEPRKRFLLACLGASVWLFHVVFALRGGLEHIWAYQIYVMPVVTLIVLVAIQGILQAPRSRLVSASMVAVMVLALAADAVHILRYRQRLFAEARTPAAILNNVDFSERGNFTKQVLYPRFCDGDHLAMPQCIERLADLFAAAQARR